METLLNHPTESVTCHMGYPGKGFKSGSVTGGILTGALRDSSWRIAVWSLMVSRLFLFYLVIFFLLGLDVFETPSLNVAKRRALGREGNVLLVFLATPNSLRMTENLVHVEKSISACSFCRVVVVNYTSRNLSHFLVPGSHYAQATEACLGHKRVFMSCDLMAKAWSAMEFFLETGYGWFWRGTDDTYVNFTRLSAFVSFLNRHYDPLRVLKVFGNCIPTQRFGVDGYLQGGSGWIMSRLTVEKVFPLFEFGLRQMRSDASADDIVLTKILAKVGVDVKEAGSPAFLGHDFLPVRTGEYHEIGRCPEVQSLSSRYCRPFVASLSTIVFFHEANVSKEHFTTISADAERVSAIASKYSFYFGAMWPTLCRD